MWHVLDLTCEVTRYWQVTWHQNVAHIVISLCSWRWLLLEWADIRAVTYWNGILQHFHYSCMDWHAEISARCNRRQEPADPITPSAAHNTLWRLSQHLALIAHHMIEDRQTIIFYQYSTSYIELITPLYPSSSNILSPREVSLPVPCDVSTSVALLYSEW